MITSLTDKLSGKVVREKTIELLGIGKKFPLRNRLIRPDIGEDFWALKDISLDIYKGELIGIIGRNGAGKTTLLNIIAGIISPTEGRVITRGRVLGLFNLGVGFQDGLTGRENIFLNGAIVGASKEELEQKISSIIEFSELGEFIDMPLGTYSQGMRLRLGFAIIANLDFDILVIDEVLAVGDVLFQSKCFERLMDFRRQGKTLVITTQSMELIERLCERVVLLDHGNIIFEGNPLEAISQYRKILNNEAFFVGSLKKKLIEQTKRWADDISNWGNKLGTKEVVIDSVEFINKFGWKTSSIKTKESLKVRVNFTVRNDVKEPHFGVAIFRKDGVYCYGPNTQFDGYHISKLHKGRGFFVLNFPKLLLACGEYRVSVAIWDKNETLAFDYHNGYYKLEVKGSLNPDNELLNIPYYIKNRNYLLFQRNVKNLPTKIILEKIKENLVNDRVGFKSLELVNRLGEKKEVFFTNEYVKCIIKFNNFNKEEDLYLWLGIYRDDGIYCQGINIPHLRRNRYIIVFPRLPLLPGRYEISLGIWDSLKKEFMMFLKGIYPFRIVFDHEDHGTVYLEHSWNFKIR
ncbi:MAG: Wzt carbohydrate-binding domain-containing protein [Candidatus Omnitrophica bacterium]|nr:Wzt carbohydrate-binding domain-containing protein [Candidatus Omnitrophota bacterium]